MDALFFTEFFGPKLASLSLCDLFPSSVYNYKQSTSQVSVVFDCYLALAVKDPEQKWHHLYSSHPDIIVEGQMPVPPNKAGFWSKKRNKQCLIDLLSFHLLEHGKD